MIGEKVTPNLDALLRFHASAGHEGVGDDYTLIAAEAEVNSIRAASLTAAKERDRALLKLMNFPINRYLMANSHGRLDGAEKAHRHLEMSTLLCDVVFGEDNYEHEDMMAVHDATQKLTSYMDTEIGFPIDARPDYETLVPLFFARFIELGRAALAATKGVNV